MLDKLKEIEAKYTVIGEKLASPEITSDIEKYKALSREYKSLTPVVLKYREYEKALCAIKEAQEIIDISDDAELRKLAREDMEIQKESAEKTERELRVMLLPKDEDDDKSVVVEIRGGAGGDEAALFAYSLYRMYTMYAAVVGWMTEIITANETEIEGFKGCPLPTRGRALTQG